MTRAGPLLQLSTSESQLVVFGPEPNLGDYPTVLKLDPLLQSMEIEVLGSRADLSAGYLGLTVPLLVENTNYDVYLHGPLPRSLKLRHDQTPLGSATKQTPLLTMRLTIIFRR